MSQRPGLEKNVETFNMNIDINTNINLNINININIKSTSNLSLFQRRWTRWAPVW